MEPLVAATTGRRWMVALVNRSAARFFVDDRDGLREDLELHSDVHGQHDQGGWSQPRYARSVEKDVDGHLREVAESIRRSYRRRLFDRYAIGGPAETVARLDRMLDEADVRAGIVAGARVEVDVANSTPEEVTKAAAPVIDADEQRHERETLDRMRAGAATGGRCPSCGLLTLEADGDCPVDETALTPVQLREATVEAAIAQDADVVLVTGHPDLGPFEGIGAALRF